MIKHGTDTGSGVLLVFVIVFSDLLLIGYVLLAFHCKSGL